LGECAHVAVTPCLEVADTTKDCVQEWLYESFQIWIHTVAVSYSLSLANKLTCYWVTNVHSEVLWHQSVLFHRPSLIVVHDHSLHKHCSVIRNHAQEAAMSGDRSVLDPGRQRG
jgi:hypothetical protein